MTLIRERALGRESRATGSRRRSDSVELAAHPGAVAPARLRARLDLRDWHLEELAPDVEQVVGELVCNSVTATREAGLDAGITLTLTCGSDGIVVAVRDALPSPPVPACPDEDSEHGRGLFIVEALTEWLECVPVPEGHGPGKLVRACIPLPKHRSSVMDPPPKRDSLRPAGCPTSGRSGRAWWRG